MIDPKDSRETLEPTTLNYATPTKHRIHSSEIFVLGGAISTVVFLFLALQNSGPSDSWTDCSIVAGLITVIGALVVFKLGLRKSRIVLVSFSTGLLVLLFWFSIAGFAKIDNWYIDKYVNHYGLNRCNANQKIVGEWLNVYAQEHGGRYPDTIASSFAQGGGEPVSAVCPSNLQPYLYFGKGLDIPLDPGALILMDTLDDQHNGKINALMGDGNVRVLSLKDAELLVQNAHSVRVGKTATQPAP